MLDALDKFLEFLTADGKWHDVSEVATALQLTEEKISMIAQFFTRYNFIKFNEYEKTVKIDTKLRKLFYFTPPENMPITVK